MIFNEYYDRALWLMLNSTEVSRGLLINFINCFDNKMFDFVRSFINKQEVDYQKDNISLVNHQQLLGDNYCLRVENNNGGLIIILNKWTNDKDCFEERYEVSLMSVPTIELMKTLKSGNNYIGGLNYKSSWMLEDEQEPFLLEETDNIDFNFNKNLFGYFIEEVNSYNNISKSYVNINKMPDKIYPHYFKSESRLKRLVRKRKIR